MATLSEGAPTSRSPCVCATIPAWRYASEGSASWLRGVAGVREVLGGDSAGDSNRWLGLHGLAEFENLAAGGFTPMEVIVASTRESAKALRLDQLGRVAPGKSADYVLVAPLAGSTLASVLGRSESVEDQLAAVFTLAREESVAVRVPDRKGELPDESPEVTVTREQFEK